MPHWFRNTHLRDHEERDQPEGIHPQSSADTLCKKQITKTYYMDIFLYLRLNKYLSLK